MKNSVPIHFTDIVFNHRSYFEVGITVHRSLIVFRPFIFVVPGDGRHRKADLGDRSVVTRFCDLTAWENCESTKFLTDLGVLGYPLCNGHRTFFYTLQDYRFFERIVCEQNIAAYLSLIESTLSEKERKDFEAWLPQ